MFDILIVIFVCLGSKLLFYKNIKLFEGKFLFVYLIEYVKWCVLVLKIVVLIDSEEYVDIVR